MKKFFKCNISYKEPLKAVSVIKNMSKAITIFVIIALLWTSIPWEYVKATDFQNNNVPVNTKETTEEMKEDDIFQNDYLDPGLVPIDFENVSKRTETEKHFRKIDGTYEVALYDQPVHYLDNGDWKDIDNRLFDNGNELENKANKFKVKFPKKLDENKKIKLTQDKYKIDWRILNINSSEISYENNELKPNNLRELVNINQSVLYKNIQNNVDLEYIISGGKIKENIILNEYVENFSIDFEFELKELRMIKDEEGNLLLVNKLDETIFSIQKLYMFDNNQELSYDIDLKYIEKKDNTVQLTITPSDKWLQSAKYPVVLDPTLNSETTSMMIYDTYISQATPDSNFASTDYMIIGGRDFEYMGLLYFYIPSNIMDKTIIYSYLTLASNLKQDGKQLNLYKNTVSFSSSNATWNFSPEFDSTVVDYHIVNIENIYSDFYMFDITNPVKEWQSTGNNRTTGFTIRDDEFADGNVIGGINKIWQMGSELKPSITIGYEEPSGLKDYWTYTSQDMGMLGTGYISDYTGNLTFVRNDFNIRNELMPFSLDFYFSNYNRHTDIGYGYGWSTNFNKQILKDNDIDKYYLLNPDGNKIYFMNEICNSTGDSDYTICTSIAEDGSRDKLIRTEYLGNTSDFRIRTKSDFEYKFISSGRLQYIKNIKTNQFLEIYYNSVTQKLDYIEDEAKNRIDFTYSNGKYRKIELQLKQFDGTYKTVEVKNYFFDSYNNLNYINQGFDYDNSNSLQYNHTLDYNFDPSNRYLLSAKDMTNQFQIEYHYSANKIDNIKVSDNSKLFSELDINYQNNKTIYTNQYNKSVYYSFDNYGHTVNIMDDYGNTTFYKYSGLFTSSKPNDFDQENEYNLINLMPNYYNNHALLYNSGVLNQKQLINPVSNHGFETENTSWLFYDGSDGIVEYTNESAMLGDNSLKITKATSDVYASQSIDLQGGEYKLEAWIKNESGGSGAYIDVINTHTKGTIN